MRPQASFGGQDLYETIFLKVAALLHSLLLNHMFFDGNKRTAMFAAMTCLELNNYKFDCSQKEVVRIALWIENQKPSIEEIADWLKKHSRKLTKS